MRKVMVLMLVVLLVVALTAAIASASPVESAAQQVAPPATLCGFLAEMMGVTLINAIVGVAISWLVEYWPWWAEAPPKWKRPIILGLCLVVPLGGLGLSYVLCAPVITKDAIYLAIMAGLAAFASSQFAHIRELPS